MARSRHDNPLPLVTTVVCGHLRLKTLRKILWLCGKESACQYKRGGFSSGVGEDPLEEETATHSSIFAWKIPWTEEPVRLPSIGSQRVGHD